MRRLLLLALPPALFCHAASARQKSDRERAGPVGPVHTVGGDLVVRYDHPREGEPNPPRPAALNPTAASP